ncbi:hypothetical protein KFL_003660110 [Klebsormidium nitens]|uniref:Uncharacterized protein n=1 Tax=Klebsormidium nitens TaxID=105231 RepID=A0A1Y1IEY8_KLENI|nr:hypothetical protein KFL_003660110 [Klebsormidium nitens]|eukprot:GAQ87631.1 hypothetical protein KFL_003660110 [Klebsormidium nitens]
MPATSARREVNRLRRGLEVKAAKRKDKERSLVLTVTLAAEEGKEEKVQALCRGIVEHFRPMVADSKSPVRAFECSQDAYEPSVYHFWQRYDGFVEMNDVYAGPEYTKFLEEVRPLLKGPVALAAYEWVNGQLGHMMNPIGPKGEGGLDDATGQGGSGGGASYKQTAQTDLGNVERESWGMESMQKGIDKVKNMLGLDNLLSGKK